MEVRKELRIWINWKDKKWRNQDKGRDVSSTLSLVIHKLRRRGRMEKEKERGQEVDARKELRIWNNRKNKEKMWRNNDKGCDVLRVVRLGNKSWKEEEEVKKLQERRDVRWWQEKKRSGYRKRIGGKDRMERIGWKRRRKMTGDGRKEFWM